MLFQTKHSQEDWEHRTLRGFLTQGLPQGSECCLWGAVVTSGQVTRKLGLSVLIATAGSLTILKMNSSREPSVVDVCFGFWVA